VLPNRRDEVWRLFGGARTSRAALLLVEKREAAGAQDAMLCLRKEVCLEVDACLADRRCEGFGHHAVAIVSHAFFLAGPFWLFVVARLRSPARFQIKLLPWQNCGLKDLRHQPGALALFEAHGSRADRAVSAAGSMCRTLIRKVAHVQRRREFSNNKPY